MYAHSANLELQMDGTKLARVPNENELAELRERLSIGVREGSVPVRKALFQALVESIEVHESHDIRPTFRLYDPSAAGMLNTVGNDSTAGQTPDMADEGSLFVSRCHGWS